jgi:hypothetical protein
VPQLFADDYLLTGLLIEFGDTKAELIAAIAPCAIECEIGRKRSPCI